MISARPFFAYNDAMSVFHDSPKRDQQFLIRLSSDEKGRKRCQDDLFESLRGSERYQHGRPSVTIPP